MVQPCYGRLVTAGSDATSAMSSGARAQPTLPILLAAVLATALPATLAGQQLLPTALPNDNRIAAGRLVDGELRVELEAVRAEWFPRGPDGPRVVTATFAELGSTPLVPGPLLRAPAGTPIRVRIRNTLEAPIVVRGLVDRASVPPVSPPSDLPPLPAFVFGDSLVIAPGAAGETRFTSSEAVASFYFARVVQTAGTGPASPTIVPGGRGGSVEDGAFLGTLVIDPAGTSPPPGERVLMITRWSTQAETNATSVKMMLNGASWPFTERLEYTEGDTVRWRVINATPVDHPMHLHGFYFSVEALGDTHADTAYVPSSRPLVVTQSLAPFAAMRMSWVAERPGNWLFHCHLIRHMDQAQLFSAERVAFTPDAHAESGHHHLDGMAGLVLGVTIHPARDGNEVSEVPRRRIDLWTGARPNRYDGHPELGFVAQQGAEPPAPDSTRVPGSPLVLARGEPTEIVVHNRLDIPLSVHWHGIELPSLYDGVGDWSGPPETTRPPIAPRDSARVVITPVRSGTFMYHTHGEPGYELSQGLYGPLLVLEPGENYDAARDRVFVLAARGARRDAAPAINGLVWPRTEHFEPDSTYRLRFLHISPDESKQIRLLDEPGEPVQWRLIARDGAELPETGQRLTAAVSRIAVGEIFDVLWTPAESGVYTLEVTTHLYPATDVSVVQRVAFAVGDVPEDDRALPQGAATPVVTLRDDERARYVGTFIGQVDRRAEAFRVRPAPELSLRVWEERDRLHFLLAPVGQDELRTPYDYLLPLGNHTFAMGKYFDGITMEPGRRPALRFVAADGRLDHIEIRDGEIILGRLARIER